MLFSVNEVIRLSIVSKRSLQRIPLSRPLVIIKPRVIHCKEVPDGDLRCILMLIILFCIYLFIYTALAVKGASVFRKQ